MNDSISTTATASKSSSSGEPYTINLDDRLDPFFERSMKPEPKKTKLQMLRDKFSNASSKIKNKIGNIFTVDLYEENEYEEEYEENKRDYEYDEEAETKKINKRQHEKIAANHDDDDDSYEEDSDEEHNAYKKRHNRMREFDQEKYYMDENGRIFDYETGEEVEGDIETYEREKNMEAEKKAEGNTVEDYVRKLIKTSNIADVAIFDKDSNYSLEDIKSSNWTRVTSDVHRLFEKGDTFGPDFDKSCFKIVKEPKRARSFMQFITNKVTRYVYFSEGFMYTLSQEKDKNKGKYYLIRSVTNLNRVIKIILEAPADFKVYEAEKKNEFLLTLKNELHKIRREMRVVTEE